MGKSKSISVDIKSCIKNVFDYFEEECQRGRPRYAAYRIVERVAAALKISVSTVKRSINSLNSTNPSTECIVKEPDRKLVDSFNEDVIRRRVYRFYRDGQLPTLHKINLALREECGINISISTLRRTLHELDFKYQHISTTGKVIFEDANISDRRLSYLHEVSSLREQGYLIVYQDETWVNVNHTTPQHWTDIHPGTSTANHLPKSEATHRVPKLCSMTGKGKRLIICHAGCDKYGLIEGCELVFEAKNITGDYHGEMNHENFVKWFEEQLMPSLPEPSVIVMDNASYHNKITEITRCPTLNDKKNEIQCWLRTKKIPFDNTMTKPILYDIVKSNKCAPQFVTDDIAERHGHLCLRLPPRHSELNPIELIWSQVKGHIARHNDGKMTTVKKELALAFNSVTPANFSDAVKHVMKIEEDFRQQNSFVRNKIPPVIVSLNEDSDEEMSSSSD